VPLKTSLAPRGGRVEKIADVTLQHVDAAEDPTGVSLHGRDALPFFPQVLGGLSQDPNAIVNAFQIGFIELHGATASLFSSSNRFISIGLFFILDPFPLDLFPYIFTLYFFLLHFYIYILLLNPYPLILNPFSLSL
jgi:hypothetical protein